MAHETQKNGIHYYIIRKLKSGKDQDASVTLPLASITMHHISVATHRDVRTGTCEMTKLRKKT